MKTNQNNLLTIEGLGSNGDGYAVMDGQKKFFPLTVTGDVIEFLSNSSFSQTDVQIVQPSAQRIPAVCRHFEKCGGCMLQHLAMETYDHFKQQQILAPLQAHNVVFDHIAAPHIIGPQQRRRVTLKVLRTQHYIHLGYYQFHSHTIVDVIECPVAMPEIVQLFKPLRKILKILLNKVKSTAEIAITHFECGLDVWITTASKKNLDLNICEQLTTFAQTHRLARLIVNNEIIVTLQPPVVNFAGVAVEADARGFLQASQTTDLWLEKMIDDNFNSQSYRRVADLFCGRGTLSLPLAKYSHVDGYEIDVAAIQALNKAIARHNVRGLQVIKRNLFDEPLSLKELQAYDCLMLNPPRAGAYAQIKNIAISQISRVIYLSCNPQSFARDAAVLTTNHYRLTTIIPIDQFHWSPHIELLAIFDKQI